MKLKKIYVYFYVVNKLIFCSGFYVFCLKFQVVFHSAATVKFDEALKLSVTINMVGTKRLVELCHKMMSLEVALY